MSSGKRIYLAYRWHDEIYCNGHPDPSTAVTAGEASWAIDVITLRALRTKGVELCGVWERNAGGDTYVATTANFLDPTFAQNKDFTDEGGSNQNYLNLRYFKIRHGITKYR